MADEQGVSFGPYRLTGPVGPLWRHTEEVTIPPKALAVLWELVNRAGAIVTKEELLAKVWTGTVVGDEALTTCVRRLRRALAETTDVPQYIQTVHRVGYRFIAPLTTTFPQGSGAGGRGSEKERQNEVDGLTDYSVSLPTPGPRSPAPLLVGREAELAHLHRLFAKALRGERQIVFVTGEAGIGKTTLIDAFVQRLGSRVQSQEDAKQGAQSEEHGAKIPSSFSAPSSLLPAPCFAWGQCIEQYGVGEAYLPVLEALGRIGRGVQKERLLSVLHQCAPTWLAQLPALLSPTEREAVQQQLHGATRERMLREISEALDVFTAEYPLVIVLEDVHWSDPSTIELLAALARRREAARLLVLATYRPAEVTMGTHPLKAAKQELIARGQGTEILLGGLSRDAVRTYVTHRLGAVAAQEEIAAFVHRRTEGHSLFMVQVTDYLTQQEVARALPQAVRQNVPGRLQQLIEVQLERLGEEEQQVLAVASVVGAEFTVASVAAGMALEEPAIEEVCERLARRGQFIEEREITSWPDGMVSGHYGFQHVLYQEVLYQRLSGSRRARLHQRIGEWEEAVYGERAHEVAAELAIHFEQGQDDTRAVQYLTSAAQRALRHSAAREAVGYLRRGLTALARLPESEDRSWQELRLQSTLGVPLMLTTGGNVELVEPVYQRARTLCQQLQVTPVRFTARYEFWRFALTRADIRTAEQVAEQLLVAARHTSDPHLLALAHYARGSTLYYRGKWATVRDSLEYGLNAYAKQQPQAHALFYADDWGVASYCHLAIALWGLGYPEQAQQQIQLAVTLAQRLAHPLSEARACSFAAGLAYFRREWREVRAWTDRVIMLGEQHSAFWKVVGRLYQGAVVVAEDHNEEGVTQLLQSLTRYRAWGQLMVPLLLTVIADALGTSSREAEGIATLDEALALSHHTGEQWCDAELWRLRGELALAGARGWGKESQNAKVKTQKSKVPEAQSSALSPQSLSLPNPQSQIPDPVSEAEGCFHKAIDIARQQHAKSLELRAVMSLVRLRKQQALEQGAGNETAGKLERWEARRPELRPSLPASQRSSFRLAEAHTMLSEVYHWFTEGFETKDLQEAKALIDSLESSV